MKRKYFLQDFFEGLVVGRISPKALVPIGGKISFLHNRFNLIDI